MARLPTRLVYPALARDRCAEAEALGRKLGDLDVQMTALALEGLVLVSQGEVRAGMARLDEATAAATAGEMSDPVAIGFACCYLIFACERVRDFDRAGPWCERLGRMAADQNVRSLRAVCRAHYGTVLMLRGDWERADAELGEATAVLAATPREGADAFARLAELRRRQGRTDDATALLARAEHHPLAILCRAALALERGDAGTAADAARRYLRLLGEAITERAPALELLAEAHGAAGHADAAMLAARELRAIAERARTDPLLGAARHAEGWAHTAAGRFDAAPRGLRGFDRAARARRSPARGGPRPSRARARVARPRAHGRRTLRA
jgi:hypothetical protein